LLENRNVLRGDGVVDAKGCCCGRTFELGEFEMFGKVEGSRLASDQRSSGEMRDFPSEIIFVIMI